MQRIAIAVLAAGSLLPAAPPPPLVCASGGAVASIDLRVGSPSTLNPTPIPLRTVNRIEEGDTIRYRPLLRPHEERKGDVTLVLVPAEKMKVGKTLLIFASEPADKPHQWTAPWRTSLVAFVYGPAGLNVKKVQAFLDRDEDLVGQLADYAEKTAKTEALITALSSTDTSPQAVNAALQGFSSKFGVDPQGVRNTPTNQQASVMLRTLNPSVSVYDPLASQAPQAAGQTAGLATLVAEMFFGRTVGLAAGGTAMLMDLGALAFPKSEFRSAFSQAMPEDGVGLCGKVGAGPVHTRVAYLWAVRVPNSAAPKLTVGKSNSLPSGVKSPLPLSGSEEDWKYLDRARHWELQPDNGKPVPVKAQVLANTKTIELELGKNVKPGRYSLKANWDWDQFEVKGFLEVEPLADFRSAKPTPTTHDHLVAGAGKVLLRLQDADFEFVNKVELKRLDDEFGSNAAVPFLLPKGLRDGVQNRMDIQLGTGDLEPGNYDLIVSQVDGKPHNVLLRVLPALPVIENLPLKIERNVATVDFTLKGKRLNLLDRVQLASGTAILGTASADGGERQVSVKLASGIAPGTTLPAEAIVADRIFPIVLPRAFQVIAPPPSITSLTFSELPQQPIQLGKGEVPEGVTMSAMIQVTQFPAGSAVRLQCEDPGVSGALTLRPGQDGGGSRLEQLTSDQLFLTFDTAAWSNGCVVDATVTTGDGDSAPRRIARIVRMPTIEHLDLTGDGDGGYTATLVGLNLQRIGKAGWSAEQETPVSELPQPLPGEGRRQKLEIHMAGPPAPDAILYISLRGESQGRHTGFLANWVSPFQIPIPEL